MEARLGTWAKRSGAWRKFIDEVPETTPADLNTLLQDLRKPPEIIFGPPHPIVISGGLAENFKEKFAEWQEYKKTKIVSEKGRKNGRGHKKKPDATKSL